MEDERNSDNHQDNNAGADNDFRNLTPVGPEQYGEGLPYAPENWPNPGDVWGWRTGKRVTTTGHFLDRYLYLPTRLYAARKSGSSRRRKGFASKLSVERYIMESFPHANLDDFFASFRWKIPSIQPGNTQPIAAVPLQLFAPAKQSESDLLSDTVGCKAGNQMCSSLNLKDEEEKDSPAMSCEICCAEPGFCRDCCCILCCKMVDSAYGGYSYIKCQVKIGEKICGHVAHLECALRSHMAGTVGGSIGLDAEYYCRRCDGRTDLISHVNKLQQTCEAINLEDDIKKFFLNLGICLLRGSQKAIAKELISHIELVISKLKCGTSAEDILNTDDNLTAPSAGFSDDSDAAMDVTVNESPFDVRIGTESSGYLSDSSKLEVEVDEILHNLRKSQVYEYSLAEEKLHAHKNYLQNLYQQLELEKSELASQPHSSHSDGLFHVVRERREQIRHEFMKFELMKKVTHGFGSTSKDILEEHFGLQIAD